MGFAELYDGHVRREIRVGCEWRAGRIGEGRPAFACQLSAFAFLLPAFAYQLLSFAYQLLSFACLLPAIDYLLPAVACLRLAVACLLPGYLYNAVGVIL